MSQTLRALYDSRPACIVIAVILGVIGFAWPGLFPGIFFCCGSGWFLGRVLTLSRR